MTHYEYTSATNQLFYIKRNILDHLITEGKYAELVY